MNEPILETPSTSPALNKTGNRQLRPVIIIGTFGVLIAFLGVLGWGLAKARKSPISSGLAPDFTLSSFTGQTLTLSKLRGIVVVINFWASWCPPCRLEAPYLEQTWRKYKDREVVFIGVDYVDTESNALAYLKEFDITYFNAPDLGTRVSQAFNIKGVPETYYVNKNGEVSGNTIGPLSPPQLDKKIDQLLAEP